MRAYLKITLPLRVVPATNMREHWSVRNKRDKQHRLVVAAELRCLGRPGSFPLPCRVCFTRHSPGTLDTDNLATAFKATRDEVAAWLGTDDSPRAPVVWEYAQDHERPYKKNRFAITIEIREDAPDG